MDIVERLLEDAMHHDELATQCDCAPEHTINHQHALNARAAAEEIKRLRDAICVIPATSGCQDDTDTSYISNLKALPLVEREQLLNGNWKIRFSDGTVFNRQWFKFVDSAPVDAVRRCLKTK